MTTSTLPAYKAFARFKGIDISKYQDNNVTAYRPTLQEVKDRGFVFVGIRVACGVVEDEDFKWFWSQAKKLGLSRIPYHYLDTIGYAALKITPEEWGIRQARFVWSLLQSDRGEKTIYLDMENSTYAKINAATADVVRRIKRSYLKELDRLSGRRVGIYTNLGYLWVLEGDELTRPLWYSRYNRRITIGEIRETLADWHYTGKLMYLQYTSNGDIDDDGRSDARALGMESDGLDLDVAVDDTDFMITTTPPVEYTTTETAGHGVITVTCARGLVVRVGPGLNYAKTANAIACGKSEGYIDLEKDLSGYRWAQISGGWIAVDHGSTVYATLKEG